MSLLRDILHICFLGQWRVLAYQVVDMSVACGLFTEYFLFVVSFPVSGLGHRFNLL